MDNWGCRDHPRFRPASWTGQQWHADNQVSSLPDWMAGEFWGQFPPDPASHPNLYTPWQQKVWQERPANALKKNDSEKSPVNALLRQVTASLTVAMKELVASKQRVISCLVHGVTAIIMLRQSCNVCDVSGACLRLPVPLRHRHTLRLGFSHLSLR